MKNISVLADFVVFNLSEVYYHSGVYLQTLLKKALRKPELRELLIDNLIIQKIVEQLFKRA